MHPNDFPALFKTNLHVHPCSEQMAMLSLVLQYGKPLEPLHMSVCATVVLPLPSGEQTGRPCCWPQQPVL